jgi:hypothetical protein
MLGSITFIKLSVESLKKGQAMANLARVLNELQRQRLGKQAELNRLDQAITALGKLAGQHTGSSARGPRRLSAAARRRIITAQKARWAKWRAQQKKAA